jgi:hypothetical protein
MPALGHSQRAVLGYLYYNHPANTQDIGDSLYDNTLRAAGHGYVRDSRRRGWAHRVLRSLRRKGLVMHDGDDWWKPTDHGFSEFRRMEWGSKP